jgi:hypothetical protein
MRQEIVNLITTQLKTITAANGYATNVGTNVNQWLFLEDANPDGALQVRDILCQPLDGGTSANSSPDFISKKLEIRILKFTNEALNKSGDATVLLRSVLKDILKCVGQMWSSGLFPDGVFDVSWGGDEFGGQMESRKYMGLAMTLYVSYRVDVWTD